MKRLIFILFILLSVVVRAQSFEEWIKANRDTVGYEYIIEVKENQAIFEISGHHQETKISVYLNCHNFSYKRQPDKLYIWDSMEKRHRAAMMSGRVDKIRPYLYSRPILREKVGSHADYLKYKRLMSM